MFILTRKPGETIVIGDDIKITLLGVYGRQVQIGVEAPGRVKIFREEVHLRIKAGIKRPESPLPDAPIEVPRKNWPTRRDRINSAGFREETDATLPSIALPNHRTPRYRNPTRRRVHDRGIPRQNP